MYHVMGGNGKFTWAACRLVTDTLSTIIRSYFKTPQLARYGVINRFEMLIYSDVNCAFSTIYALSRTHLRGFKTASNVCILG